MPYPADERLNATSGAREQQSLQQPDLLQGFPAIILMDLRIVNDIHEPFFSELPEKAVSVGK